MAEMGWQEAVLYSNEKNKEYNDKNYMQKPYEAKTEAEILANERVIIDSDIPMSKEGLLALASDVSGNGRLFWDGYRIVSGSTINQYIKPEYLKDPVYMSMKLPSDAVSSYLPSRVNGSVFAESIRPDGYNHAIGIGALYASNPSALPSSFNVYFGKFAVYTIGMEESARWVKHEEHKYPPTIARYSLPWTGSVRTDIPIESHDDYAKITVTKEMLTDGVIHFYGANSITFPVDKTRAMVCMFELWTDARTDSVTKNVFSAIGVDQRVYGKQGGILQLFSGRNIFMKSEKYIHIGHSIADADYDVMVKNNNDPKLLYDEFCSGTRSRVTFDEIPEQYVSAFTSIFNADGSVPNNKVWGTQNNTAGWIDIPAGGGSGSGTGGGTTTVKTYPNIIDPTLIMLGYDLNTGTGSTYNPKVSSTTRSINGVLVPTNGNSELYIYRKSAWAMWMIFYNSSNKVISYETIRVTDEMPAAIPVPSGAVNFAIQYTSNVATNCQICVSYDPIDRFYAYGEAVEIEVEGGGGEESTPTTKNPCKDYRNLGYASCFDKVVFIGDSLTIGAGDRTNGASLDMTKAKRHSYPHYFGKLTGCEVVNLGEAGATAVCSSAAISENHAWYTRHASELEQSANIGEAYVIYLGTNDLGYYSAFTANTSNPSDTTTSLGGYLAIINKILAVQPKAKIFLVTLPKDRNSASGRKQANDAIKVIAGAFPNKCFVVDLEKDWQNDVIISTWKGTFYNGGHPNALGYMEYAKAVESYISYIVSTNLTAFDNLQFIGTNCEYVK